MTTLSASNIYFYLINEQRQGEGSYTSGTNIKMVSGSGLKKNNY